MSYSVALCIPTYERPAIVQEFLFECADYYIKAGIDFYFYDSSESNETEACVKAWPDHEHIFYIRLPSSLTLAQKIAKICQRYGIMKDYDFLWFSNDNTRYVPEDIITITQSLDLNYDFVIFDAENIINSKKIIKDPKEILMPFDFMHSGASMMNVRTMLENIDWKKYPDSATGFGYTDFFLHRFLELNNFTALYVPVTRRKKSMLQHAPYYESFVLEDICKNWVSFFKGLPEYYTNKMDACRYWASKFRMYDRLDFEMHRRKRALTFPVFIRYWASWKYVTNISRRIILLYAMTPVKCIELRVIRRKERELKRLKAFCKAHKSIAIWGSGYNGTIVGQYMEKKGIYYDYYCANRRRAEKPKCNGKPVMEFGELKEKLGNIGFIVVVSGKHIENVLPVLKASVNEKDILYDTIFIRDAKDEMGYVSYGNF